MIYTDGVHLISDISDIELHIFAEGIGLKRKWFQDKRHRHYDLKGSLIDRALLAGAKQITTRELVRKLLSLKKYGLYDAKDNCWLGDNYRPAVFYRQDLAKLAAIVANKRTNRYKEEQWIEARPYILKEPKLMGYVETEMSALEALKHLEEGGI